MHFKFDYGSQSKCFFSVLFETIGLLCQFIFSASIIALPFIYVLVNDCSDNDIMFYTFGILFIIVEGVITIRILFVAISKKGVFIYDDNIVIRKRFNNLKPFGFNNKILISDIVSIEKVYYKKPLLNDGKYYTTFIFNPESVVIIKTDRNTFYTSIGNADEFVSEVLKIKAGIHHKKSI